MRKYLLLLLLLVSVLVSCEDNDNLDLGADDDKQTENDTDNASDGDAKEQEKDADLTYYDGDKTDEDKDDTDKILVDGDSDNFEKTDKIDLDKMDKEPDQDCPELECNCIAQCDGNMATNCKSITGTDGCGYHKWTYDDCTGGICKVDFDNDLAYCEFPDGDIEEVESEIDIECDAVPSNCVDQCENNKAKHCESSVDSNGCGYNKWTEDDCSGGVCKMNETVWKSYCEFPDGDLEELEIEAEIEYEDEVE